MEIYIFSGVDSKEINKKHQKILSAVQNVNTV